MITVISMLFLSLILLDFYILMVAFLQTRRARICHIALVLILLSLVILNSLSIDVSLINNDLLSSIIQIFLSIPASIYIIVFLVILAVSITLLYKEKQYEQNTITRTSIKESIDNLPMGLCFSTEKGMFLVQ